MTGYRLLVQTCIVVWLVVMTTTVHGSRASRTFRALQSQLCAGKNTKVELNIAIDNSDGVSEADYNNIRALTIQFIKKQEAGSALSQLYAGITVFRSDKKWDRLQTHISNNHPNIAYQFLKVDYFGTTTTQTTNNVFIQGLIGLIYMRSPSDWPYLIKTKKNQKVLIVFASKTSTNAEFFNRVSRDRSYGMQVYPVALNGADTGPGSAIEAMAGAEHRDRIHVMDDPSMATDFPSIDLNLCGVDGRNNNPENCQDRHEACMYFVPYGYCTSTKCKEQTRNGKCTKNDRNYMLEWCRWSCDECVISDRELSRMI